MSIGISSSRKRNDFLNDWNLWNDWNRWNRQSDGSKSSSVPDVPIVERGIMSTVDPVTLQVIQARLAGIVQEMQNSLFRTGYSTIIRESQDASCAMLESPGRSGRPTCRPAAAHGRLSRLRRGYLEKLHARRSARRRRLHHQPSLSRRQSPRSRHGGAVADIFSRRMGRLRGQSGAQERHRRPGAGQLLEPGAGDLPGRAACPADQVRA